MKSDPKKKATAKKPPAKKKKPETKTVTTANPKRLILPPPIYRQGSRRPVDASNPRLQEAIGSMAEGRRRKRWQSDPYAYITERLGVRPETIDWNLSPEYAEHKWDGTPNPLKRACDELGAGRSVGIQAAVSTGKTFFGACIALWFFECFEDSLVVTTATKQDQLKLLLWRWIGEFFPKLKKGFINSLQVRMYEGSDAWTIVGLVAGTGRDEQSATKAQGFHAPHMLWIVEEMPGVSSAVIAAAMNTRSSPHNLILGYGNPDHKLDPLNLFCQRSDITAIRISGLDHPNVVKHDPYFIQGGQSEVGLARIAESWGGEDHPFYKSRARGMCPEQAEAAAIKIEWLYAAVNAAWDGDATISLGVDVANSAHGDKAAKARGTGNWLRSIDSFQCPDAGELGYEIAIEATRDGIEDYHIGIDGASAGAATITALRNPRTARQGETQCRSIKARNLLGGSGAEKVQGEVEEYANLRGQMIWAFRNDLMKGLIKIPNDPELFGEAIVPEMRMQGTKIMFTTKEQMDGILGHSPDKFDAVIRWNWVRRGKKRSFASEGNSRSESGGGNKRGPSRPQSPSSARDFYLRR